MKQLLRIDASSRIEGSHSCDLGDFFINKWLKHNNGGQVIHRDLVKSPLPHIREETITGFFAPVTEHDQALKEATKTSDKLISELMNADTVLITTPMYNFSIPSSLKAWIDQIVRIGQTFNFSTETGAVFLNDGMQELDYFKLTRRMTTRSSKIREKYLIFSTLASLATIQLINLG